MELTLQIQARGLQCLTGRLKPTMPLDWALEIRLGVFVKS